MVGQTGVVGTAHKLVEKEKKFARMLFKRTRMKVQLEFGESKRTKILTYLVVLRAH